MSLQKVLCDTCPSSVRDEGRGTRDEIDRRRLLGTLGAAAAALAWQFDLGRAVVAPPGVHGVTVYAGTAGARATTPGDQDSARSHRDLFALADDGTERWRLDVPGGVRGPVLAEGGDMAYVASGRGQAFAVPLA